MIFVFFSTEANRTNILYTRRQHVTYRPTFDNSVENIMFQTTWCIGVA